MLYDKIMSFNKGNTSPTYTFMEQHHLDKLYQKHLEFGNGYDSTVEVKLFNPCGCQTWLLCEMGEDGYCFGAVDLGYGFEIGSFDLEEILDLKLPYGLRIERDNYYETGKSLKEAMSER